MSNSVFSIMRGGKIVAPKLPEEIPELDEEQYEAGEAMAERKSMLLLSDPGAGKTLTALHALSVVEEETFKRGGEVFRVLILCPPIATRTWYLWTAKVYQELGFFGQVEVLRNGNADVHEDTTHLVVSHALLSTGNKKLAATLANFKARVLIVDESDNFTGWDSARTKALFGSTFTAGLAKFPEYAWFLTGTPIPRYQDGLYPVLKSRFNSRLEAFEASTREAFLGIFCRTRMVRYGNMRFSKLQVCGSRNEKMMNSLLFGTDASNKIPAAVRLKLRLGPPNINDVALSVDFSKEYRALELEVLEGNAIGDDGVAEINPKLATALRLMGEESAPAAAAYVLSKLEEKRKAGDKRGILVLHWHKEVGNGVSALMHHHGFTVGEINGSTTTKNNDEVEDKFNSGELDVCIGQIAAMGVALNLQGNSNHVIFVEDTFSYTKNLQAYQRVWRRGQKWPVTVDFCRPETALSDMKPSTAYRKRKSASIALDGVADA